MVRINHIIESMSQMSVDSSKNTFAQALRDKYVDQDIYDYKVCLPKDNKISTQITLVGFDKVLSAQKQLIKLISIDLSNENIESAGCLEGLAEGLIRIRILNLADNSLSWYELSRILKHFPKLSELILTNNPLFDKTIVNDLEPKISLKSLTLGGIYHNWSSIIEQLSNNFTFVDKIDLWNNQLNEDKMRLKTSEYDVFIEKIKSIKLSHNYFKDINWLKSVGPIYNLVELDLSNCSIEVFKLDTCSINLLKNLKNLNISYNEISDWKCISDLWHLSNLQNLICHENPIFITEKNSKFMTVGLLGQITTINREEITKNMRKNSEVFYLRTIFPRYQDYQKGQLDDFRNCHPRYEELIGIYGLPDDLTKKPEINKYVSLDLCYDGKRISKKLPRDMKLAKVEMLCKKLFNFRPATNITLICSDKNNPNITYKMDNNGQTLHYYSVENGNEILVEKVE